MSEITDKIALLPAAVRPIVRAARRMVRATAPRAEEVVYRGGRPRSPRAMWKLIRYVVDAKPVLSIGTYPTYAVVFFYRGRELEDGTGLLEGTGADLRFLRLRSSADPDRPAVKRIVRGAFRLAGSRTRH